MKKNTRKLKKAALLLCSAVLLVCISIGATVAYLTSTDEVVNTFTVGNVTITLDEAKVNPDGTKVTDSEGKDVARVNANQYHLLPGHTYIKDPTIHVDANSEDCWLFVKVENGIAAIEDTTNNIAAQMAAKGWTAVSEGSNVFAYRAIAHANENISVFDSFKISGNADVSTYASKEIKITAYAIQADGFDTAAAAWTAAKLA